MVVSLGLALSGCSLLFDSATASGDGGIPGLDGGDPPESCEEWLPAPEHFSPCSIPEHRGPLDLNIAGTYVLNTTTAELLDPNSAPVVGFATHDLDPNGSPSLLLSVGAFRVDENSILRVKGDRGLVIASWSVAIVAGAIDVASSKEEPGAGAVSAPCTGLAGGDGVTGSRPPGSGGGGGAFQTRGGGGGGGDNGTNIGGGGGGGLSSLDLPPILQGGCPGGNGGGEAAGGLGGGAVEIAAANSIAVGGEIYAGGAGGEPGNATLPGGGGGGGSGGWIGLDAPTVSVGGSLAANGGGGGGGGGDLKTGEPGADAIALMPAAGGPGGNDGGKGGNGASLITGGMGADGEQGLGSSGGGGGGGGVGFIVAFTADLRIQGAILSPPILDVRSP
jgi:hypothetical protein